MSIVGLRLVLESPAAAAVHDHAQIPIAFDVTERLDLSSGDRVHIAATIPTRAVHPAYVKDYDLHAGQSAELCDMTQWWFAGAFLDMQRIGGAVVIPNTRGVEGDAPDNAVLWDIRVHPAFRRRGVGRALLAFAESHARACGHRHMQIETQDINVPACRFYSRAGYTLTRINPHAYASLPDEVQLIWQRSL